MKEVTLFIHLSLRLVFSVQHQILMTADATMTFHFRYLIVCAPKWPKCKLHPKRPAYLL